MLEEGTSIESFLMVGEGTFSPKIRAMSLSLNLIPVSLKTKI